jgi:hypothetical protein
MQARKFYLDTQNRTFVASPTSTLRAVDDSFFAEDVEAIELYFLNPTGRADQPYEYADYSANTVKLGIGITQPAALQTSWTALATSVTATITSLVTGGSGSNEVQRITLSPQPVSGGWAIQLPSRNVTVSSVSANVFTAADHGLYSGQSVSLTAFSLTSSSVANGSSYFVIRNGKDTFSLASTASSTTALTASVTSGGGTVALGSITTPQLAHNAQPSEVAGAFASAGLVENGQGQITVTGTAGKEYLISYANGSANRDYANVSAVGSTLLGAYGLTANIDLNTVEMAALVANGNTTAKLEVEVAGGGKRQTYQRAVTLSPDIISSTSPTPVGGSAFILIDQNNDGWLVTIDSNGVLTTTKQ